MTIDAGYLRTLSLWAGFPDRLVWFDAAKAALRFLSAEHRRVYEKSQVVWAADLADRRPRATDVCRQFVEYLDLKHILLLSHERDVLAIDRIVSSRS
jgi:hypothetical protein